ncbi:MAG: hypothetical protein QOI78_8309 [Actinomycetota bacterium]|nr:hypothetical protein [Actinomycetota bacterium]
MLRSGRAGGRTPFPAPPGRRRRRGVPRASAPGRSCARRGRPPRAAGPHRTSGTPPGCCRAPCETSRITWASARLRARSDDGESAVANAVAAQHGRVPGAQVLRRALLARQLLEPLVDVGRVHLVPGAAVAVDHRPVATRSVVQQGLHDLRHRRVPDGHRAVEAALGGVPERALVAADPGVLAQQCRDAVGAVLVRVLFAAGAEDPRSSIRRAVAGTRSCFSSSRSWLEVLAPPGVVGADRLDVAVRVRADPDVPPRRRDDRACTRSSVSGSRRSLVRPTAAKYPPRGPGTHDCRPHGRVRDGERPGREQP